LANLDLDIVDRIQIRFFLLESRLGCLGMDLDPVLDLVPDLVLDLDPDSVPDMVLDPAPNMVLHLVLVLAIELLKMILSATLFLTKVAGNSK
jgi:hypothetical protein